MTSTRLLPVAIFLVIAGFFLWGLYFGNPREVPSPFIGRTVPEFTLPALATDGEGLASADLKAGDVTIVNLWASWCGPCRVEHPMLMELAESGEATLYGINYKDTRPKGLAFLEQLGDPFDRVGFDEDGRAGLDWGLTGVPETFVIAGDGTIVYKHIGPIVPGDLESKIRPAIAEAKAR